MLCSEESGRKPYICRATLGTFTATDTSSPEHHTGFYLNIPADPSLELGKLGLLESRKQLILKKSIWKAITLAFFTWTNLENSMMFDFW